MQILHQEMGLYHHVPGFAKEAARQALTDTRAPASFFDSPWHNAEKTSQIDTFKRIPFTLDNIERIIDNLTPNHKIVNGKMMSRGSPSPKSNSIKSARRASISANYGHKTDKTTSPKSTIKSSSSHKRATSAQRRKITSLSITQQRVRLLNR